MEYTGQDVGSISNRYEVQLLEIGKSEPTTEKLLTVFKVLEDVIPQLGVFKKVKRQRLSYYSFVSSKR